MTHPPPSLHPNLPLLALMLACHATPEPPEATHGKDYMGSAGGLAARAAPPGAVHREGPWSPVIYARDTHGPAAMAMAEALSARVVPFEGALPTPPRGELALIWLEPGEALDLAPPGDGRHGGGEGAVAAVLASGDTAWSERATQRLPWASMGVLDTAVSTSLWADPALAIDEPRVAGLVAARELADHYTLAWTPAAIPAAIPGLIQHLGTEPWDPSASDPRARATGLTTGAHEDLAEDPEVAVRLAVAHATTSQRTLAVLSQDRDPLVRARAADRLDDPERLATLGRDPSSVVRVAAFHRMAQRAHEDERSETLATALRQGATESPDAYVRWKAVWGLGAIPGQLEVLEGLVDDPDVDVRRELANALAAQRDPAAVAPLGMLLQDPNNFLRAVAARGLGDLGDPAAIPLLRRAVDDPAAQVAVAAAMALEHLGASAYVPEAHPPKPPRSEAELQDLLHSADPTVLKDACKFSAERPDTLTLIGPLSTHTDGEVRKAVAQALGWSADATPQLITLLGDEDLDVVVTALESLRRVGGFDPAVLDAALVHPDAELRLRAVEALATAGPSDRLGTFASDPDERTRAAVARVLPDAVGLDDPSVLVRRAAAAASPAKPHWAEDPSAMVRYLSVAAPDVHGAFWALGVITREDELVYQRFSFNDERDRPTTSYALRPAIVREYGHPDRG